MKRLALVLTVALALAAAPTAGAAIQIAITSPRAGAAGLTGVVPVNVTASADMGIYSVQLLVDGTPYGQPDTTQISLYHYSIPWDTTGIALGAHTLAVKAVDWSLPLGGVSSTTTPITVNVGPGAPTIAITIPPSWTFVRGTVQIHASVTSSVAPTTVTFAVDGQQLAGATWNTTTFTDGSHTITGTVTDGRGRTATASATVTVDNTAPTAVLYAPPAGTRIVGPTTLQVHASDAYGVGSVQFTVDGQPVGGPLTQPDGGTGYLYSALWDATNATPGMHTISAVVTDNAGNVTTLPGVRVTAGGGVLPVLNYHEISPPNGYSIYDETPAEADQQLGYLKANGYHSVTLEQYQQWLAGANIGVAKPVLITVDDGLRDQKAWDPLLARYGFEAVLFEVTGFADNTTPGDSDPNNLSWGDVQALAATGRWEIAFHAGKYGHGDSYAAGAKVGSQTYSPSCPYFYTCLSYQDAKKRKKPETFAQFQNAVMDEVQQGVQELRDHVPNASLVAIAMPFNDAGQWTNLYNDPSGQVQGWLPGFFASQFPIVFTQTNPITYAQASGTVGSLTGYNRRYRFEVHTDTTIAQFAAALGDPAFAR